ncbi:MAG: hypothetical protein R3F14_00380 [Polyangiaceae bacterium]
MLAPFVLACSGSQSNPDVPEGGETTGGDTMSGAETTTSEDTGDTGETTPPPPPKEGAAALNATQREQMELVLKRGAKKAENCSESVPDGKGGEGQVGVLFDGQKGRITDVTVGAPWAGTSMEACIKRAFVGEIIVPFEGQPLEVPYDIKVPPKAGATDAKKKPGTK